jgi:hypothetical protein
MRLHPALIFFSLEKVQRLFFNFGQKSLKKIYSGLSRHTSSLKSDKRWTEENERQKTKTKTKTKTKRRQS